ncbi:MAG: efflux RND transporter periplasmic adaptor subunit [Taibaiella sp.]|nr:efflux RND transporter periplasmic adaptor subunit [Taibaiella sp.]
MKHIQTIILTGAVLVLASCGPKKEEKKTIDTDVIPVKVMELRASAAGADISTSGQFTTDDEAILSFKTGGIIEKVYVKEGDAVHAGQVLATLNMTEINAQVQVAKTAFEKASRDYQRVTNLYKDSVATLEQSQNAKTAMEIARQQLTAAEFNKEYSQIRATKSGYVLRKLASEGQVAGPGTPVFQVNGAKSGTWTLKAGVSDREWAAINLGDKATITVAALNNKTYEGVVCRKSEGADAMTGSFNVEIKFTSEKPAIAAGMFGKAVVHTADNKQATSTWAIPYDALLDGDGNTGYVFVTKDRQTAHKLKVEVNAIEKDEIIVSGGLEDAGALIISGSAYLTDSSKINVIQ